MPALPGSLGLSRGGGCCRAPTWVGDPCAYLPPVAQHTGQELANRAAPAAAVRVRLLRPGWRGPKREMGDQRPSNNHFAGSQPLTAIGRRTEQYRGTKRTGAREDLWEAAQERRRRYGTVLTSGEEEVVAAAASASLSSLDLCLHSPCITYRRHGHTGTGCVPLSRYAEVRVEDGMDVDVQTGAAGFVGLTGLRYCLFARNCTCNCCTGYPEGEWRRATTTTWTTRRTTGSHRNACHPAIPSQRWRRRGCPLQLLR